MSAFRLSGKCLLLAGYRRTAALEEPKGRAMQKVSRAGVVTEPYLQPFPRPIQVRAGEWVSADFEKVTDVPGWVWCTDERGRSG